MKRLGWVLAASVMIPQLGILGAPRGAHAEEFRDLAAGPEYKAGWLHNLVFGAHWRDLWTVPMHIPVLDFDKFGGGLTVLKRGGGKQTRGLRLKGADGKQYKFRSINKDPSKALPPELRDTLLSDVVQDQISSANPLAPIVVDEFASALGIFQTRPQVVVLPDDARLGEFRKEFAGLLGTIEENPTVYDDGEATWEDVDKVKSTFNIFKRLESDPDEQVDALAFLRVRLMDLFIGDWDRHQKQWRWARTDTNEGKVWRPIARDRDQAFSRMDGLFPWLTTLNLRQINGVGEDYPRIEALTWSGRYVDRRLLTGVSRTQWDKVTAEVLAPLTDELIDKAVRHLPKEMFDLEGAKLEKTMRSRRDKLKQASEDFYKVLADYVVVRGTELDDLAVFDRIDAKHLRVSVFKIKHSTGEPRKTPYFDRTFDAADTREVRWDGLGGNDKIEYRGGSESDVRIRILKSEDRAVVAAKSNEDRFEPPRDYGYDWWFQPLFKFGSDQGLLLGGGPILYHYEIGDFPYAYKMQLVGGYAIGTNLIYAAYSGDFPVALRPLGLKVEARASELEVQNYFGNGNETGNDPSIYSAGGYKRVMQDYVVTPTLSYGGEHGFQARLAPGLKLTTIPGAPRTLLGRVTGGVHYDSLGRVDPEATSLELDTSATYYPAVFDNPNDFEKIKGELTGTLALPLLKFSSISVRGGAERVIGNHPFYESAFLGGQNSLRGFVINRFAGDSLVFSGAETRIYLTRFKFLFPAKMGLLGFADIGRVYADGQASDTWHTDYGAGIWTSWIAPQNSLVLSLGHSVEGNILSAGVGFAL